MIGVRRRLFWKVYLTLLAEPDRCVRAALMGAFWWMVGEGAQEGWRAPDGTQVYFGIAGTNLLDDQRTMPFMQPDRERFLEYDLTRLVYELSNPKRSIVGVMTALPMDGNPQADDDAPARRRALGLDAAN